MMHDAWSHVLEKTQMRKAAGWWTKCPFAWTLLLLFVAAVWWHAEGKTGYHSRDVHHDWVRSWIWWRPLWMPVQCLLWRTWPYLSSGNSTSLSLSLPPFSLISSSILCTPIFHVSSRYKKKHNMFAQLTRRRRFAQGARRNMFAPQGYKKKHNMFAPQGYKKNHNMFAQGYKKKQGSEVEKCIFWGTKHVQWATRSDSPERRSRLGYKKKTGFKVEKLCVFFGHKRLAMSCNKSRQEGNK